MQRAQECILTNLLEQKKDIARRTALWAEQASCESRAAAEAAYLAHERELASFHAQNHTAAGAGAGPSSAGEGRGGGGVYRGASSSAAAGLFEATMGKEMRAYWLPSKTPDAGPAKLEKPDKHPKCPISGSKLSLKDLVAVRFTPVPDADGAEYMDPLTQTAFGPASKLVVLAPTGAVLTEESYTKASFACLQSFPFAIPCRKHSVFQPVPLVRPLDFPALRRAAFPSVPLFAPTRCSP